MLVPQGHALHLSAGDSFFDKVKWKRGGNGKGAGSWRFRPHKHAGGKLSYRSELHAGLASLRWLRSTSSAGGTVVIFNKKQYKRRVSKATVDCAIREVEHLLGAPPGEWDAAVDTRTCVR